MRVVILGVTTGLGGRLAETLLDHGMTPVGLIRRADQAPALQEAGVEPVVFDASSDGMRSVVVRAMTGAGAVVLAAGTGTGPGSLGAATAAASPAVLLAAAAERAGVRRFVLVSAMQPGEADRAALGDDLSAYLREKATAEQALRVRDLDWCVLRSGMLEDSAPTGRILLGTGEDPRPQGPVGRADLAATVRHALTAPGAVRRVLAVSAGPREISEAMGALDSA
ncbi:NAD(P)H-binding protein [Streptomyces sp. SL13]|uniref:NAD(P)H-binding protein n=1 Tax=Streptantibioticus silvisoli TaxID=2705255 RepID=A0AA90KEZ5_9ACTN|nr:NAD(P)H-binding protein [Streptantibioticus silvisoli]MDI5968595.1 NAD(P)H-binding protein [Streptantibioticus silvisoli]